MSQSFNQSLAALAAVLLTVTSVSAIITIPPASAHTAQGALVTTELA